MADDGLRYLNPEIVRFMKAAQSRHQDVADAETAIPLLDPPRRAWLRKAVTREYGDHPRARLG